VAQACCPEAQTVEQLLARRAGEAHHLAFGLRPLDDALRGGAPAGCITELVGQAGAGKTQLCKQLTVSAQLPVLHGGMGGSVVYIDTEKKFSASRLVEIATARWPERFATPEAVEALTRGVVLYTPSSGAELLARLDGLEAVIIERGAKLVVIDSIAGAHAACLHALVMPCCAHATGSCVLRLHCSLDAL
jgi:RAD51-like protein 1